VGVIKPANEAGFLRYDAEMRILHVGWGFQPWRWGGLIEYAEDLMEAQAGAGHHVGYFFAGRHNVLLKRPRVKTWRRNGIRMFEILNCPIHSGGALGTRQPAEELHEPICERLFSETLDRFKPDIIHIQELFGLPSSLIDIAKARDLRVVMSLQDHYVLCPTLFLVDHAGSNCKRRDVGEMCVKCCRNAPAGRKNMVLQTLRYRKPKWLPEAFLSAPRSAVYRMLQRASQPAATGAAPAISTETEAPQDLNLSAAFQRRRDVNVERLNKIDLLAAMSSRCGETYQGMGVSKSRLVTLPLALRHMQSIHPKTMTGVSSPLNFVTLAGCRDRPKGAHVVLEALHRLAQAGLENHFRLFIYGFLMEELRESILGFPNVEYRGTYKVEDLNSLLDGMNVGIVPSTSEEPGPCTGIEMLAKGIPVIGNKIGGIPDYVQEGITGWLNTSNDGAGLARIMARIIHDPSDVLRLNELIVARHESIVKPMARHVKEVEELYKAARQRNSAISSVAASSVAAGQALC
jgi:glycosyltransferase involved in cell wall biosynthesis